MYAIHRLLQSIRERETREWNSVSIFAEGFCDHLTWTLDKVAGASPTEWRPQLEDRQEHHTVIGRGKQIQDDTRHIPTDFLANQSNAAINFVQLHCPGTVQILEITLFNYLVI